MENSTSLLRPRTTKIFWGICSVFFLVVIGSGILYWVGKHPGTPWTALSPPPNSLAEVVGRVAPSVVNVLAIRQAGLNPWLEGGNNGNGFPPPDSPKRKSRGFGAGFIIDRQGTIVTNEHVIQSARTLRVILASGEELTARLVGSDKETDLALLRIQSPSPLEPARWGNSDKLQVGDAVFAVGNPYNYNHSVTAGIISAKDRIIEGQPFEQYLQTDARINVGNSGGPLFNFHGEVVGITTAISTRGKDIGFAIPVNHALPILRQLEVQGRVRRGYLGIRPRTVSTDLAQFMKLSSPAGIMVEDLAAESGAARAGLKRYDVLIKLNGRLLKNSQDYFTRVSAIPPGSKVQLEILRDGKTQTLEATVQERVSSGAKNIESETSADPQSGLKREDTPWGIAVQELPEVYKELNLGGGVFISAILPYSPAAEAELLPGDILLEINRVPVGSLQEYRAAILKQKQEVSILLLVSRPSSGTRIIVLKKDELLP